MAILAKHGSSFRFAGAFLSQQQLQQAARLYAFCRWIDDIADHATDKVSAQKHLCAIRTAIQAGASDTVELEDFLDLVNEFKIPKLLPCTLIDGVLTDLEPTVNIGNVDELMRYAYRVAGVVGLMMCPILRAEPEGWLHAVDLGMAMQLTNIARDVMTDAALERKYLPTTWCDCSPQDIRENSRLVQQTVKPAIRQLLNLAEEYYASGALGFCYLPKQSRTAIAVAATVYRHIGIKLHSNQLQYWQQRVVISQPHKVLLALQTLLFGHPLPRQRGIHAHRSALHGMLQDLLPHEFNG